MGDIQMKVNTGSSINVNKGQTSERTNNAPNQVSDQKKSAVQKSDSINTIAQSLAAESGFDQNKVNIIKQQIQSGNYPLDSRKIAESFLSLEKLID